MMAGGYFECSASALAGSLGKPLNFDLGKLLTVSVRFIGGDGLQNKFFLGSHPNFSSKDPKKFGPVRGNELELSLSTIGGHDGC
ncbi:MAG: hypothetical protein A4S09_14140 [Proteobacteria bacterium SG_bin7]|nr:MAG: hypothetical protein A4S09_14140 [Proteobacteria bacterium SG_bin7]